MKRTLVLAVSLLALLATGCVSALRVHEKASPDPKKLRGVPFYVKKQICQQTTIYTETWYEVTIGVTLRVISEVDGEIKTKDIELPSSTKRVDYGALDRIRSLQQLILRANNCQTPERCIFSGLLARGARSGEVRCLQRFLLARGYLPEAPDGIFGSRTEAAVQAFQRDSGLRPSGVFDLGTQGAYHAVIEDAMTDCPTVQAAIDLWAALPDAAAGTPVEVANYAEPVVVVDYHRELYLNGKLPWFGEATVTTKLNADGTLSEASTTVATKVAEALTSLLPLKEYLTGEFVRSGAAEEDASMELMSSFVGPSLAPALPPGVVAGRLLVATVVELSVEEKGYKYTFSADHPDPDGLCREKDRTAIAFSDKGDYKREALDTKPAAAADTGKKIEFAGNVSLPKESGKE